MSRLSAILFAAVALLLTMLVAVVASGAAQAAPARDPDISGLRLGVQLDGSPRPAARTPACSTTAARTSAPPRF